MEIIIFDWGHLLISTLPLLFFLYIVQRIFKYNPILVLVLAGNLLGILSVFISLIIIEQGVFLFELEQWTSKSYSSLYYLLFLLPVLYEMKNLKKLRFERNVDKKLKPRLFIILSIGFIILSIMLIGDNLFGIKKTHPILSLPYGNIFLFFYKIIDYLLLIFSIHCDKRYLPILILIFILLNITQFSFTSIFLGLIPILGIRIYKDKIKMMNLYRKLDIDKRLVFISLVAVIGAIWFRAYSIQTSLYTIYDRLVSTGQMFWAVVENEYKVNTTEQILLFFQNIFSVRNLPTVANYGLGEFMITISPSVAPKYVQAGVRFAGGSPAIYIYHFGFIAGFVIYALIVKIILRYYYHIGKCLLHYDVFGFILLSLLGLYVGELLTAGDFAKINLRSIIYLSTTLFYFSGAWKRVFIHNRA